MCCSALERSNQGTATSTAVKNKSGIHLPRIAASPPRENANGNRIKAAAEVRKKTSVGGDSSPTATRMNR